MAVYLCPFFGAGYQSFTNQGLVNAGGSINTYAAGTTTPQATYSDSSGGTPNATTIPLDAAGRIGSPTNVEVWLTAGQAYKVIVKDVNGVQLGIAYDNLSGINDPGSAVAGALNAWNVFAGTPTFINATQFSLTGNQTASFPVGTRVKSTVTAGTAYGTVSAVAFGAFTTVTLNNDGTVLDSGLSQVAISVNTVTGPNVGAGAVNYNAAISYAAATVGADLVAKAAVAATTTTNLTAVSKATATAGGPTVFTLTPVPAIGSYVTGQTWLAQANAASSGSPTINISGQGAKNLKQFNSSGSKVTGVFANGAIYELAYDGVDVVIMNPSSSSAGGSLKRITPFIANGTWTKQGDAPTVLVKVVGGGGGAGQTQSGGGGGYAEAFVSAPGATETVTVGGGGSGSSAAGGGNGVASSFGAWAVAGGGVGTGAGGSGTTGDVKLTGGSGSTGVLGGPGGNSVFGGGAGITGGAGATNTGGGGANNAGSGSGGAGGSGIVIVYEFG